MQKGVRFADFRENKWRTSEGTGKMANKQLSSELSECERVF